MEAPIEWQCTCGRWIPVGYSQHVHADTTEPTFEQMHAMRRAAEAGLEGVVPDAFTATAQRTVILRTKEMPTR